MSFLKVNITTKTRNLEDVPQEYMGLGGRGLTSIMINLDGHRRDLWGLLNVRSFK